MQSCHLKGVQSKDTSWPKKENTQKAPFAGLLHTKNSSTCSLLEYWGQSSTVISHLKIWKAEAEEILSATSINNHLSKFCMGYGNNFVLMGFQQNKVFLLPTRCRCMQYSQRGQAGSWARVPQLDGLLVVLAARGYQGFDGVPVHTLHVGSMTW